MQVNLTGLELRRPRPFGNCWLASELWRQLGLTEFWQKTFALWPAAFVVGYHIGMRLGTLQKLEWEQVDLNAGEIRLLKKQVKQKRAHTVPSTATCGLGWICSLRTTPKTGQIARTCFIG